MNKRGVALIIGFMVIIVLAILGAAILSRGISERNITQRYKESIEAFWLAEAGVNRALNELRNNFDQAGTGLWAANLGSGSYSVDVENIIIDGNTNKKITVHGRVPATSPRIERNIEAMMRKHIPPGFYDHAIYSAGKVDFNGNSFTVVNNEPAPDNKAVVYAGDNEIEHPENITGTVIQDTSISPLARLDFEKLYDIAARQGYVYDAARLKNIGKTDSFPSSFWSPQGTDGIDNDGDGAIDEADEKVNVVYVETDLELKGNIGTIGGFYVVVGDVINTPDVEEEAIINGNGQIQGAIYTRGTFRVNGGGGNLNIDGGVWSGVEARLNGNANVSYNETYMDAIGGMNIEATVQVSSWREVQNPYQLNP